MLTVFLSALGFSLALIGASASGLVDHLHAEAGGNADADSDTGHGGLPAGPHGGAPDAHGLLSGLFSLRFFTWALGGFGATGSLLNVLGISVPGQLGAALGVGALVGGGTVALFRRLRALGAGTVPEAERLLGHEGVVVQALKPGGLGKIRLRVNEQDLELLARAGEDETLGTSTHVVIVRYRDEVAEVRPAPWEE